MSSGLADVTIICATGSVSQCDLGKLAAALSKVPSSWQRWTHAGIFSLKHFNDFLADCECSSLVPSPFMIL